MFEISEIFKSLEGEGPFTGVPTLYIRFARCNLKCPLFNNKGAEIGTNGYAELGFNPTDYNDIKSMPFISKGCDSQYSVNPRFSHTWQKMGLDDLVDRVIEEAGVIVFENTGKSWIVSLTGGEPMIRYKRLGELINHPRLKDVDHYLIETNATIEPDESFRSEVINWLSKDGNRQITWSNSPKLDNSGHSFRETLKPRALLFQHELKQLFPKQVNQYVKFVISNEGDISEVKRRMEIYYDAGLKSIPVYLMPAACTIEQLKEKQKMVSDLCLKSGYIYCTRLQNELYGNTVGT